MERSHFLEANSFSASQGTPRILWNSEDSLPLLQAPVSCPILGQINPIHYRPVPDFTYYCKKKSSPFFTALSLC
jgi:hypothetical protein